MKSELYLTTESIKKLNGAPLFDPNKMNQCIIDIVKNVENEWIAVYSYEKLIEYFNEDLGSIEDAIEWIDYNVLGVISAMGNRHPLIIDENGNDLC